MRERSNQKTVKGASGARRMTPQTTAYTIPCLPKSLNQFAGRGNVWAYREEKKRWKELCAVYCKPCPSQPVKGALVTLFFYFADRRRRDVDNLAKAVLDGLVACGVLEDDCYQCIDLLLQGGYDKQNPRTEIYIQERDNAEIYSGKV